jgi:hypothetical protein
MPIGDTTITVIGNLWDRPMVFTRQGEQPAVIVGDGIA